MNTLPTERDGMRSVPARHQPMGDLVTVGGSNGNPRMKIAHREIGPEYPPLVIAEIGINHGGDLKVAKDMVRLAAQAGAECIKHQTHFVEDEMTDEAKSVFPPNADVSIYDVMQRCALTQQDEIELKAYTEKLGLIYLSTPFSRKAADFLNSIDVPAFKIGSGEADHLPLIRVSWSIARARSIAPCTIRSSGPDRRMQSIVSRVR